MISIGIDIGSYSVKVARVEGSAKGFRVLSLDDYPLPTDPAKDITLDILEILRDIHTRYGNESIQYIVGAEQNHISSRRRSFPFKERHKILKSLPFELEDDIPLSIENAVFEAKLTHFEEASSSVLAMACPKEHVVAQLQRLDDAGIEPQIMSSEGVAISNLFEDWLEAPPNINDAGEFADGPTHANLVLHIGHSKTVCSVLVHGHTLDHFTIDWGGRDLAKTISIKYSLHYVEAIKELKQKAFILTHNDGVTKEQMTLSDILKTEIDRFANQLRLAVARIETQNNVTISQAILCGGTSGLRNFGPYLTQKLEIPFNKLSQIDNLDNLDFGSNPNNEISHIVSIGLAAEGVKRPKNPAVNFLRGEFMRQNESMQAFWNQWGPAVQATVGLFFILLIWGFFRLGTAETIRDFADDSLRNKAKEIMNTPKRPKTSAIRSYIRDQKRKAKELSVFKSIQGTVSAMDILKSISSAKPNAKSAGEINVQQLRIEDRKVTIIGYGSTQNAVTQLQRNLRDVSSSGKVNTKVSGAKVPAGQTPFQLEFITNRIGGL